MSNLPLGANDDPNAPFNEATVTRDVSIILDGNISVDVPVNFTEEDIFMAIKKAVVDQVKCLNLTVTDITTFNEEWNIYPPLSPKEMTEERYQYLKSLPFEEYDKETSYDEQDEFCRMARLKGESEYGQAFCR